MINILNGFNSIFRVVLLWPLFRRWHFLKKIGKYEFRHLIDYLTFPFDANFKTTWSLDGSYVCTKLDFTCYIYAIFNTLLLNNFLELHKVLEFSYLFLVPRFYNIIGQCGFLTYRQYYRTHFRYFEKSNYQWGLCTNHVDRILGNFDPPPPYVDTFTK